MKREDVFECFGTDREDFEKKMISMETLFDSEKDRCKLFINLANVCNLSCEYCCAQEHPRQNYLSVKDYNTFLNNYLPRIEADKIFFYMFGGEPTLHPHFDLMTQMSIDKAKELGKEYIIITQSNMTWKPKRTKEYIKKFKDQGEIYFALSFHPIDERANFKNFCTNARLFYEEGMLDGINLMMPTMDRFDEMVRYQEMAEFYTHPTKVQVLPIFQIYRNTRDQEKYWSIYSNEKEFVVNYIEEGELKRKEASLMEINMFGFMHFKGYKCDPGHIVIDTEGNYFKCQAEMLEQNIRGSVRTDTDLTNFENLANKCMTCPYDICLLDFYCKKSREENSLGERIEDCSCNT